MMLIRFHRWINTDEGFRHTQWRLPPAGSTPKTVAKWVEQFRVAR
jgi:hypothetical protein